jgi:hypothetical protein
LVGADQMKNRIYGVAEDADSWLLNYISVRFNFLCLLIDINFTLLDFYTWKNRLSDGRMDGNERKRIPFAGRELDYWGPENCGVRCGLRQATWIARQEESCKRDFQIDGGKGIGTKGKSHVNSNCEDWYTLFSFCPSPATMPVTTGL